MAMGLLDWHEGSIIVPPGNWFHQHFNTDKLPARYLALRWGSQKFRMSNTIYNRENNEMDWGNQIEYEDEDPKIRSTFERELANEGISSSMPSLSA